LAVSAIGIKISLSSPSNSIPSATSITGLGNIVFGCVCTSAIVHFTPQQFTQVVGTTHVALGESTDSQAYSQAGFTELDTLAMSNFSQTSGCGNGNNAGQCYWSLSDWDNNVTQEVSTHTWVKYWQIWDEPQNFQAYDDGYLGGCVPGQTTCTYNITLSTAHYAQMLEDAYQIIHKYIPSGVVMAFGGDNIIDCSVLSNSCTEDPANFQWAQMVWNDLGCGVGTCAYANAISLHIYPKQLMTTIIGGQKVQQYLSNSLNKYISAFDEPIYVTETGVMSNIDGFTAQTQATFIQEEFQFLASFPSVKMVLWYQDNSGSNPYLGSDFGLWTSSWQPKPSFYVWDNFVKSASG
jgi:hypothetical protein